MNAAPVTLVNKVFDTEMSHSVYCGNQLILKLNIRPYQLLLMMFCWTNYQLNITTQCFIVNIL